MGVGVGAGIQLKEVKAGFCGVEPTLPGQNFFFIQTRQFQNNLQTLTPIKFRREP